VIPALEAPAVALEIGASQAGAVGDLLAEAGFGRVQLRRDLSGLDRVLVGHR
jgi:methylase of polypeptide subunit release factors